MVNILVAQYVFPVIPNVNNVLEWPHSVQIVIQSIKRYSLEMTVFVQMASTETQLLLNVFHAIFHVYNVADHFLLIVLYAMEAVPLTEY